MSSTSRSGAPAGRRNRRRTPGQPAAAPTTPRTLTRPRHGRNGQPARTLGRGLTRGREEPGNGTVRATATPLPTRLRLALLAIAAMLIGSAALSPTASAAVGPQNDPFYAAPADLDSLAPGATIRTRRITLQAVPGVKLPFKADQVLYRTTNSAGEAVATAATIIRPLTSPKVRQLVSHQIAYDGLSPKCRPSYALRTGTYSEVSAETLLITGLLARGWTVVTSDYEGPDDTWIAGEMAGKGTLDGIRAALDFTPAGLTDTTKVALDGYSGGGHATAWANELHESYAPELNIVGAAQGGVPANLNYLLESLNGSEFAGVLFAAIAGLRKAYPEVNLDQYLNAQGLNLFGKLQKQCIVEFLLSHPKQQVQRYSNVADILSVPEIRQIADTNTLGKHTPTVPTLMYHAVDDHLVGYKGAGELATEYCAEGAPLFWRRTKGDHVGPAVSYVGEVQKFIAARFAGRAFTRSC